MPANKTAQPHARNAKHTHKQVHNQHKNKKLQHTAPHHAYLGVHHHSGLGRRGSVDGLGSIGHEGRGLGLWALIGISSYCHRVIYHLMTDTSHDRHLA